MSGLTLYADSTWQSPWVFHAMVARVARDASNDPVPPKIVDYALAQWGRASVRKDLAHIPTTP